MFKWTFIVRMPWKPVALSHCAWSPVPSPQRDDVGGVTSGLYPLWYLVRILAPHSNWVTWTNGLNYGIVSTLLLHNSLTLNIYWCHSLATCHSPKNNNLNISISTEFDSMVQFLFPPTFNAVHMRGLLTSWNDMRAFLSVITQYGVIQAAPSISCTSH